MQFANNQPVRSYLAEASQSGSSSGISAQPSDLLAHIFKAMSDGDQSLADLIDMVRALSDRLAGDVPFLPRTMEPHPPAPGALNEMLWRAQAQNWHLDQLRERLSALLRVL